MGWGWGWDELGGWDVPIHIIYICTPLSLGVSKPPGRSCCLSAGLCVLSALGRKCQVCRVVALAVHHTPAIGWGDKSEAVKSLPEGHEPSLRSELGCRVALTQEPPCSWLVWWLTMTSRRSSPHWRRCCLLTPGRSCKKLFGNFLLVAVLRVATLPWPRGGVCHLRGSFTSVCGWWRGT